jgi:tetratricopeptide (TPR) repeat protein
MMRVWVVIGLISLGLALLPARHLLSTNLGWVELTKQIYGTEPAAAERAETHFSAALQQGATDSRAATGRLIQALLAGQDRDEWREPVNGAAIDWARVMAVGEWLYNQGNYTQAMRLFAAAHEMAPDTYEDAWLSIGSICQQILFTSNTSTDHLGSVFDCDDYWESVSHNLIVNGDFARSHLRPWFKRYQTGIVYRGETIANDALDGAIDGGLETESAATARQEADRRPVAVITSANDEHYGGLYQSIHLPPGTHVRFSARIKVAAKGPMLLYPLYIRGETEEGRWRRSLGAIRESTEWMMLEHEYRIPADHHLSTAFYPVYFQGAGTVWVDDVRLKVLE